MRCQTGGFPEIGRLDGLKPADATHSRRMLNDNLTRNHDRLLPNISLPFQMRWWRTEKSKFTESSPESLFPSLSRTATSAISCPPAALFSRIQRNHSASASRSARSIPRWVPLWPHALTPSKIRMRNSPFAWWTHFYHKSTCYLSAYCATIVLQPRCFRDRGLAEHQWTLRDKLDDPLHNSTVTGKMRL